MKKTILFAAIASAAIFSSCTPSTPKANIKSDVDSLSYSIGMSNTQGLKEYLVGRVGIDTTYMSEFIKGVNEAANAADNKKKEAYFAGIQIGQQISQQMMKGINYEVFGNDSTQSISMQNFMAGFVAGVTGENALMTMTEANEMAQRLVQELKAKTMEKNYGENKKAGEAYLDSIAQTEGIQKLDNGVYYKVLVAGKGATPESSDRVKVHYEGTLIDGTVFDSSYERKEPATFGCTQVIPGWTNALTHMPVGSTWMVYIPQDQAYGAREAGKIKPFSALTFKIELLSIEK
ncbi:MAG: FKBP-type peptidyl-prolyl cis-trans isomerase [Paraprevotella sp.]|jgi:FKBP-type peptidyl-prolyl cis-trans isomerase FklB|nr:FKBP-type peptidyl-prolyl cis-trans isomerase [Paraprevotella sp.]